MLKARELVLILLGLPLTLAIVGAFWFASQYIKPAPPREIVLATGGTTGAYYKFGKTYARTLSLAGIHLEVISTKGSLENIDLISGRSPKVDAALLQGGIANSKSNPGILSLGRMFLEPVWVFYRSAERVDRLSQLVGKRIAVGPEGSGTRHLATDLLAANFVTADTTTLSPLSGTAAAHALVSGQLDAIFIVSSPESPLVQDLLRNATIKLLSFAQADAYTRRFPFLRRVVLPRGAVDLAGDVPAVNIELVAAEAALVVREDLHPAVVGLLAEAASNTHKIGGFFHHSGEFPSTAEPEFAMSDVADRIYKSGPPFLQRFLPFWVAIQIDRLIVLALPIATILLPLFKGVPMLYKWRVRRRLLYWYERLKGLERRIALDNSGARNGLHLREIEEIDFAVAHLPVPVTFSDQLYELRAAIDLVHKQLLQRSSAIAHDSHSTSLPARR